MDLLRHLRFFDAVAEHRHFGHAAAALGMTQPPVSQGVQRLEQELGQRLFFRDARGVRLTEAGGALLPVARRLLRDAEQLMTLAHRWRPSGQVRLGLADDLEDKIPALLTRLAERDVDCVPTVSGTVELVEGVREDELDIAVVRHPAVVDGLAAGPVHTLATYLAWDDDRPRDAELPPMREVPPVVVPPRRHHPAAHDQLIDALRRLGHSGAVIEAGTLIERQAWASAGHGVRLVLDDESGRPIPDLPPLRVRVVTPLPPDRRADVDHETLIRRLEAALS
ncbi:LysR family transcriptional regulator [Aeromicrobium phragmitis]|uniref:LysR family transcriptional regulator n=1 Tax=Aeromicrobium phragmitis TaxID=2478914 RepID=UPI002441428C|nr:LysR family transcriptional regulator [Aeromicrobium phragmitis]